jgi:hypothetical protein
MTSCSPRSKPTSTEVTALLGLTPAHCSMAGHRRGFAAEVLELCKAEMAKTVDVKKIMLAIDVYVRTLPTGFWKIIHPSV